MFIAHCLRLLAQTFLSGRLVMSNLEKKTRFLGMVLSVESKGLDENEKI
jgi:hypothetical protein